MKHMDQDERDVAEAVAGFLRDGDEKIDIGKGSATMTMHAASDHSAAGARFCTARVVCRDWTRDGLAEYEVEITVRRKP